MLTETMMTIDPGIAAVAIALFTILGGAAGAVIQRFLAAKDRREAEMRLDERERRARFREYELKRIDHTRRQVERARLLTIDALAGKTIDAGAPELELSDMALVGDAVAARRFGTILVELAGDMRSHMDRTGQLPVRLMTDEEQTRMLEAREAVMAALDAQERRALADEPILILKLDQYR
jgi:hypothetical protein